MNSAILCGAILALLAGPSFNSQTIPRIDNPASAPSSRSIVLESVWQVGDDLGAGREPFGRIADLTVDAAGNVYVLDEHTREVRVFAPNGDYLRIMCREQEGPGKLDHPTGLAVMPDATLGVWQAQPPRISRFTLPAGEYAGDLDFSSISPFQSLAALQRRGASIYAAVVYIRSTEAYQEYVTSLSRFDARGKLVTEYTRHVRRFEFSDPVIRDDAGPQWTVAADGRVYVNNAVDYEIVVYGPDGGIERVITRDYERLARSSEEMAIIRDYYRRVGHVPDSQVEISAYHRDIAWLGTAGDGRLWVLSSRGSVRTPDGVLGVFDVYDSGGRLAEAVELKARANPRRDRYYLSSGRLFVIANYYGAPGVGVRADAGEAQPKVVTCYRISP